MEKTLNKLLAFWRRRSLKFWLATGMLMSIGPIFASAVTGYHLYHRAIIQPLVEVASKQRHILQPLLKIELSLWDVSKSVTDFAIDGDAARPAAYKTEADQIDIAFANLISAVEGHGLEVRDVNGARNDWSTVNTLSNTILSGGNLHGDAIIGAEIEEFETRIDRLGRQVDIVFEDVRAENEQTHDQALADLVLSERLAVAGFVVSIIFAAMGVAVINGSLVTSMDTLASGAMRLAAGDRKHHIEVQIPYELGSVAKAFNVMTNKILEQEQALARAAATDGLTGLFNRREFDRLLTEEIQRGDSYGAAVSLIMIDIDHFKNFNDTYGHQGGDEALRAVALTVKKCLRDLDKPCRFGGEEFIVILPGCGAEAAHQTAERLRAEVEAQEIRLDGEQVAKVTISLGVATYPGGGTTSEALLKSADAALYKSKENGRNRVTVAV